MMECNFRLVANLSLSSMLNFNRKMRENKDDYLSKPIHSQSIKCTGFNQRNSLSLQPISSYSFHQKSLSSLSFSPCYLFILNKARKNQRKSHCRLRYNFCLGITFQIYTFTFRRCFLHLFTIYNNLHGYVLLN